MEQGEYKLTDKTSRMEQIKNKTSRSSEPQGGLVRRV